MMFNSTKEKITSLPVLEKRKKYTILFAALLAGKILIDIFTNNMNSFFNTQVGFLIGMIGALIYTQRVINAMKKEKIQL